MDVSSAVPKEGHVVERVVEVLGYDVVVDELLVLVVVELDDVRVEAPWFGPVLGLGRPPTVSCRGGAGCA
eukprot:4392108-Amphidinium_carterae.1